MLEIIESCNIDVLLPISTEGYNLVMENTSLLNTKTCPILMPDKSTFKKAEDKAEFARFCACSDILTPKTILFDGLSTLDKIREMHFPVLLKPIYGEGGVGIKLFAEIDFLLGFARNNVKQLINKYIIQEYIRADEVDVNLLCHRGKIISYTIQKGILPGKEKFRFSEGIQFVNNINVYEFVEKLFRKLNWTGVAHVDLLYDKYLDKIYALGINPRLWSTVIGSLRAGVNFSDLLVKKTLNESFIPKDQGYKEIKYAHLDKKLLYDILQKSSPFKLSETNLSLFLSDPLPSLIGKF